MLTRPGTALIAAAAFSIPTVVFAISTVPNGAAPVNDTRPYVGYVRDQNTPTAGPVTHLGTGSAISPTVVLTAAHVLNGGAFNPVQSMERFAIGNQVYFGLGVRDPAFAMNPNDASGSINDIGLIILLNGLQLNQYASVANAQSFNVGDTASIVGDTNGATNPPSTATPPLLGKTVVKQVTPQMYFYDRTKGPNLFDPGDSGGPTFTSPTSNTIVGIHAYRTPAGNPTQDVDMRTDPYISFIGGDGDIPAPNAAPASVLNRLGGVANGNWSNVMWARGSAAANVVPLNNDVAILDPTAQTDNGTTITYDATSAATSLEGLLNDVVLQVKGGILSVPGNTGALNGDMINVNGGSFAARSLDNLGTLSVSKGAVLIQPALNQDTLGILNGSPGANGTIMVGPGGTLTVHMFQAGIINSAGSTLTLQGDATGVAGAGMDALTNSGMVSVLDNSSLGASTLTNNANATIQVQYKTNGVPSAGADNLKNSGNISVTGGILFTNSSTTNSATGVISTSAAGANNNAQANLTNIVNQGKITVGTSTFFTANLTTSTPAPIAFDNQANATFSVLAGGDAKIYGTLNNSSEIDLACIPGLSSKMTVFPDKTNKTGSLVNNAGATINFLGPGTKPTITFQGVNLMNSGSINGAGILDLTSNSSFINQATLAQNPNLNFNSLVVSFSAASNGNNPVTMEAPSVDIGAVVKGLTKPFAFAQLDFQVSSVQLVDNFQNEGNGSAKEAIYTTTLGIGPTSANFPNKLDLNGLTIYYLNVDPLVGLNMSSVVLDGGMLIQIPEPTCTCLLCGIAAAALARRHRR